VHQQRKGALRQVLDRCEAAQPLNLVGASGIFRIEFDRNRPLQDALYRNTYALMAQTSQTAACNRIHEAEPRLGHRLLMTQDRVGADESSLSREFLVHMLGMRREGVTEAASSLRAVCEGGGPTGDRLKIRSCRISEGGPSVFDGKAKKESL